MLLWYRHSCCVATMASLWANLQQLLVDGKFQLTRYWCSNITSPVVARLVCIYNMVTGGVCPEGRWCRTSVKASDVAVKATGMSLKAESCCNSLSVSVQLVWAMFNATRWLKWAVSISAVWYLADWVSHSGSDRLHQCYSHIDLCNVRDICTLASTGLQVWRDHALSVV